MVFPSIHSVQVILVHYYLCYASNSIWIIILFGVMLIGLGWLVVGYCSTNMSSYGGSRSAGINCYLIFFFLQRQKEKNVILLWNRQYKMALCLYLVFCRVIYTEQGAETAVYLSLLGSDELPTGKVNTHLARTYFSAMCLYLVCHLSDIYYFVHFAIILKWTSILKWFSVFSSFTINKKFLGKN